MAMRILWIGTVVLASLAAFAAGVVYGMPIVSIESHYDLDRTIHRLFWEMRESDTYLTHSNYMLLMSADRGGEMIALYPNDLDSGSSHSGVGWSLESTSYRDYYPNGTRLYRAVDPDGNTLREIAFHDARDKVVMMAIIDYKKDYLTASERDRINKEFYPDDPHGADPPAHPARVDAEAALYGSAYELAALSAKRDALSGEGGLTPQRERFYRWAFEEYSVPNSTESIDRRLAEIAGDADPRQVERLVDRVNSGVDAGFVPEGAEIADGEFWSKARLSAHCDATPGCDLDVEAMVDRTPP